MELLIELDDLAQVRIFLSSINCILIVKHHSAALAAFLGSLSGIIPSRE